MVKDQVLRATAYFMRPIARLLLRGGIAWSEFSEISKQAFVDVARQDYGLQGRPTNVARVAMITGLSRREVTRVRDVLLDKQASPTPPPSPISRVLTGWHVDDQFIDADGRPLPLERFGEGATLETLLRRYAGAMPHGAIVKEILQLGLMVVESSGEYRVTSRHYTRHDVDPDLVWQMGRALHDHASTLAHNVNDRRDEPARFERIAWNLNVDRAHQSELSEYVERHGQTFLEDVDAWLSSHEADSQKSSASGTRMGVGVYLYVDDHDRGGQS